MFFKLFFLLVLFFVNTLADYVVKEDNEKKEEDVVGIGLVYRPSNCQRTTRKGDLLRVFFNGTLADGTVFSSKYMNKPFEFVLGEGQVIQGWEAGLMDMCKGEIRHLTIPPVYAWGNGGLGGIPSRVNMYFFVQLETFHAIADAPRKTNAFAVIDVNKDQLLSRDEVKTFLSNNGVQEVNGDKGVKQMLRDIFQEEDTDHNGYIEHHEFSGRKHDEL